MTEKSLPSDEQLAIQKYVEDYIRKWLGILGISSVGAILLAIGYFIFFLPGQAIRIVESVAREKIVETLSVKIENEFKSKEQEIDLALKSVANLSEQVGKARDSTNQLIGSTDEIRAQSIVLGESLLEASELVNKPEFRQARLFVDQFGENASVASIPSRIRLLESSLSKVETGAIAALPEEIADFRDVSGSLDANQRCLSGEQAFRGIINRRVEFSREFENPPIVQLSLGGFDSTSPVRIQTRIASVDRKGFTASVYTYCDTRVFSAQVTWIAVQN